MHRSKRLQALTFILSLCLGAALSWISLTQAGYRLETIALDRYFQLRYRIFGTQPLDPRIILVGVDATAMAKIGRPLLLWQPVLSDMVTKIKQDKPAVIGVDFLISPKTDGLSEDDPIKARLEDEALDLAVASQGDIPVVLVERFANDEYTVREDGERGYEDEQVFSPHEVLRDLLMKPDGSIPALGIANVVTDIDGTVRRLKLLSWQNKKTQKITPSNFFIRLLEQGTQKDISFTPAPTGSSKQPRLTWNNLSLPFIFSDSFILNYPGPTEDNPPPGQPSPPNLSFPIIPASGLIDGTIAHGTFKDKIVIIAPTADTLDDNKVVPGDISYFGAAIHATAINMFLTNQFIYRPPAIWLGLISILTLLGAVLGQKGKLILALACGICIILLEFLIFYLAGVWLPAISSLIAYISGSSLGYIERFLTVEQDRALVRSTFARMVSPQVMKHVLQDLDSLQHGIRKEITVLFVDINGFTPICEKLEPEVIIKMLSQYFSQMVEIILKNNGYLKQYVGDEIMVIFGAPDDRKDHATRALFTALEMREVLTQSKIQAKGELGFYDVKIGINTGPVVLGKVGPEKRWEYAAVGDTVNLGARIMTSAKKLGTDIAVSETTKTRYLQEREILGLSDNIDPIVWSSEGAQSFKGKTSKIEIFTIK